MSTLFLFQITYAEIPFHVYQIPWVTLFFIIRVSFTKFPTPVFSLSQISGTSAPLLTVLQLSHALTHFYGNNEMIILMWGEHLIQ